MRVEKYVSCDGLHELLKEVCVETFKFDRINTLHDSLKEKSKSESYILKKIKRRLCDSRSETSRKDELEVKFALKFVKWKTPCGDFRQTFRQKNVPKTQLYWQWIS